MAFSSRCRYVKKVSSCVRICFLRQSSRTLVPWQSLMLHRDVENIMFSSLSDGGMHFHLKSRVSLKGFSWNCLWLRLAGFHLWICTSFSCMSTWWPHHREFQFRIHERHVSHPLSNILKIECSEICQNEDGLCTGCHPGLSPT